MRKDVDIKNRIVNMHDVDTWKDEAEIIKYLDKQMKVRLHSVFFSPSSNYTYVGSKDDQGKNSLTITGYTTKTPGKAILIS